MAVVQHSSPYRVSVLGVMQLLYRELLQHTHAHALKKKKEKQTENNNAKMVSILKACFSEAHYAINLPTLVTAAN